MKKHLFQNLFPVQSILVWLVVISLNVFTFSCDKKETVLKSFDSTEELVKSLGPNQIISWMIRLPQGTSYRWEDGMVKINLPQGYELLGYSAATNQIMPLSGFTCTCADGSTRACKPFTAGDFVGCATYKDNPCQRCIGTHSTTTYSVPQEFDAIYLIRNLEEVDPLVKALSGFSPIQPIFDASELTQLPWIDETEFNSPGFDRTIRYIQDYLFPNGIENGEGGTIPSGTSLWAWRSNQSNSKFFILVPLDKMEPGAIELLPVYTNLTTENFTKAGEMITGSEVYCTGSCDNGICVLRRHLIVRYCDGCNTGCTIHYSVQK